MRRPWTAWIVLAGLGVLANVAWGDGTFEDTAVKRLLGKDCDGAKIVAVQGSRLVTVHLKTRKMRTLASFKSSTALGAIGRPWWSPDGAAVLYTRNGKAYAVSSGGGTPRVVVGGKTPPIRDAAWWKNPKTKAHCVVYATRPVKAPRPVTPSPPRGGRPTPPGPGPRRLPPSDPDSRRRPPSDPDNRRFPPSRGMNPGGQADPATAPAPLPPPPPTAATFLHDPKAKAPTKLVDFACTAGLSRDGTHLGHAGVACGIVDLKKKKLYRVNRGRQASDGSMSPDDTYRLMFLPTSGATLAVRNRYDREVWKLSKPRGSSGWHGPRWSNHPNFCTATAKIDGTNVIVLVKISTKQSVILHGLSGDWRQPHLWLPSPAGAQTASGPIDHLVLKRLGHYKAKVAKAKDYSPIIAELKLNPDPEAATIITALESYGKGLLSRARHAPDALTGQKIYRDLAVRYSRHEIGLTARRTLSSAAFRTELAAAPKAARFEQLRKRLHKPPGENVKANFYDETFMTRNRAVLVEMVTVLGQLRQMHAGTRAYERAKYYASQHGLPKSTSESGNQRLKVTGIISAVSPVPAPEHILPAKDALVYVRYRVKRVVEGRYPTRTLVAVHWAVRYGRATAAANFRAGQEHHLTVDLFDAHPELEGIPASSAANDANLAPYWVLSGGR